jgi:hypothetical protein
LFHADGPRGGSGEHPVSSGGLFSELTRAWARRGSGATRPDVGAPDKLGVTAAWPRGFGYDSPSMLSPGRRSELSVVEKYWCALQDSSTLGTNEARRGVS